MFEVTRLELDTHELEAIAKSLGTNTDGVLRAVAFDVEAQAKAVAPRDPARPPMDPRRPVTGALKNSIHTRKIRTNEYRVEDGVEYGIWQEMGTSRIPARPFMRPAVEKVRAKLADYFKRLFA